MRKTLLPAVAASALILLGAGCAARGTVPTPTVIPSRAQATEIETEGGLQDAAMVRIGPEGFTPASVSIKKGEIVTWINEDPGGDHWPASGPHPTHADYPEFDPKEPLIPGQSWTFKFNKVGTWEYHDHLIPKKIGTVTVSE